MTTFPELVSQLKNLDELTLIELLNTNSSEIVEMFIDKIEDMQDRLRNAIEE